ncbi:uncharacterized protein LOC117180685 [Belonocnema kinseyi]|uniref:uncharacterized protein LOC117180685 n=1 Tax=Belonocnema kinseyi TaxID=2817044 RepID=UPI00143D9EF2|nr:uncharacterized protein LOC117180685 [Belonocnema kinseyi]
MKRVKISRRLDHKQQSYREAQQWLEKRYPVSSPSKSTIFRWYTEFKRGRTDPNDAEHSGRPLEAVTPENVMGAAIAFNGPCHKSMKTMAKINELGFDLLPHHPYSPDLDPSDYWLFADLKKMLQGK